MWWDNLTNYQQVLFVLAITATVVMLIFMILSLIGIGDNDFDGDVDVDSDFDGFNDEPITGIGTLKLFTIRSALVFISIGSWVTFLFIPITNPWVASLIGVLLGAASAVLVAYALKQAMKLESIGNIDYSNAIGKTATVYIRVPKEKSGIGKVHLTLQERFIECYAVTLDKDDLTTDMLVQIVGLEDETTLIVTKKVNG